MIRIRYQLLISLMLLAVLASGCATSKTNFVYTHPEVSTAPADGLVLAYQRVEDQRTFDQNLDGIFKTSPIENNMAGVNIIFPRQSVVR